MSQRTREEFESAMYDAALLPPGDPQRERVEVEVARAGEWAKTLWLEILSQDEHLRIVLRQVAPPPGLSDRLRAVTDHQPVPERSPVTRWLSGLGTKLRAIRDRIRLRYLAPTAVLLLVGGVAWHSAASRAEHERRLHTLALLAMQDHMNESDMVVRASDPARVAGKLSRLLDFAVRLPDMGRGLTLLGGRRCHLGSHRVALTLWKGGGDVRSLYQFKPHELGIERLDGPVVVRPHGPVAGHTPCEVLFWSEAGASYALVTRPAHGD